MRLQPVWRIARWEAVGGGAGIDRRTLTYAAVGLIALMVLVPLAASAGPAADEGLYRVGVATDSPYRPPVEDASELAVAPPNEGAYERGRLDVLIADGEVRVQETRTGRAAAAALREATADYNDRLMRGEPDQAAAFPVAVELRYADRSTSAVDRRDGREPTADDGGNDGGEPIDDTTSTATSDLDPTPAAAPGGKTGFGALPLRGTSLFPQAADGTPASIAPPFPFASLVLAFAFVIPMNFVVQAYASSVRYDRGNRRAEPLLVVPVSKWSLIIGKALPYFGLLLAIAGVIAWIVGGGLLSIFAVVPLALLFLGGGFVAGMLARSHKELTFVLVAVSVGLTTYAFVPALFVDVHPIAAISPLSLVVRDLEGTGVSFATAAFSTGPAVLAAAVLYGFGAGLYREQDLFTQVPIPAKVLDALAAFVTRPARVGWASLLAIPFVFLVELLAVALLFALPASLALPGLFVVIATIEELAKSLPAYAGFARHRYDRSLRTVGLVGAYSGAGFFLGEKVAAIGQLVGLFDLDIGRIAFELGAGVGGASEPGLLVVLLLAPLGLHVFTAMVTAFGASRDASWYSLTLVGAIIVHATYNLAVVSVLA